MTRRNNAKKRAARAVSRAEGLRYVVARRRQAEQTPPPPPPPGPRHVDDLLHDSVQSWCAQQPGEPLAEHLWTGPDMDIAFVPRRRHR